MAENFQQTVDLREQMEKKRKITPLEKIYREEGESFEKKDLRKISRPEVKERPLGLIKTAVFILAILVVGFTAYKLFFKSGNAADAAKKANWYAVKLVDGEIFYGQVADTKADPVVMANVYYNYDQAKDNKKEITESGNIRLVKRGQETHGPAGTMDIVRAQVLFMEPLKADSKVLQAILQYEK